VHNKEDWEFQENVMIAEHSAITRATESFGWFSLMISKESFTENIMIQAKVKMGEAGNGIGFLFNIPEAAKRLYLNDGYCLWLGSDLNRASKLFISSIEVMQIPEVVLHRNQWYTVCIEKLENTIYVYLDEVLQFSYVGHMPILGTHVGLLSRDADFEIQDFSIFVGSQNIMINCLSVPDAFLAQKDYETALSEYRRIGYAFPGRAEGREAMFRAGVTLLEKGKNNSQPEASKIFDQALEEFEKLHKTPGAPLEYLGKSLVYQATLDWDEEIKCLELAFRRYPKHPLLYLLQEQIIYRMHENSRSNRNGAYQFVLLALRHIPQVIKEQPVLKLITHLKRHWENLDFLLEENQEPLYQNESLAISLSFWLEKPYVLHEIIDELKIKEPLPVPLLFNAFFCLIKLGSDGIIKEKLDELQNHPNFFKEASILKLAIYAKEGHLEEVLHKFSGSLDPLKEPILLHLLDQALDEKKTELVHQVMEKLSFTNLNFDCRQIWAYLLEKNWGKSGEILHAYSFEELANETSLLHFLFGCWLYATEGKTLADIHFSGVLDVAYPRSWSLGSHYIIGKLSDEWFKRAFSFEKNQLKRQLELFKIISA
jgi:serine/threonine-protein kinase